MCVAGVAVGDGPLELSARTRESDSKQSPDTVDGVGSSRAAARETQIDHARCRQIVRHNRYAIKMISSRLTVASKLSEPFGEGAACWVSQPPLLPKIQ